jgi:hypothetical protein
MYILSGAELLLRVADDFIRRAMIDGRHGVAPSDQSRELAPRSSDFTFARGTFCSRSRTACLTASVMLSPVRSAKVRINWSASRS